MKHDADRIIMHVDMPNLQSLFLAAANVPKSLSLKKKMAIIVCPDPYVDAGLSSRNSLPTVEPTIMERIAIGKWLDYEIPTEYHFS